MSWAHGLSPPRELFQPIGIMRGGRRAFEFRGDRPGFIFPMAVRGGEACPKLPPVPPPQALYRTSPRYRSSEVIGSFCYASANPQPSAHDERKQRMMTVNRRGPKDLLSFELEDPMTARRWGGGPRFNGPHLYRQLPPLTARTRIDESYDAMSDTVPGSGSLSAR